MNRETLERMTKEELIEVIKKAVEEAKKHHIHHYVIACSIDDYNEIKAICKSNFPSVKVKWARAIEKGKIYLWDEPRITETV